MTVQDIKKEDIPAVMVLDKNAKLSDQLMLDRMYELAKVLQDNGLQILNVEKRLEAGYVYVVKCGGAVIKHSTVQTEIFTDSDQEYSTILKCMKSVLGVCVIA